MLISRQISRLLPPRNATAVKALLACGIAASIVYVAADVIGSLRYSGYSYRDQAFSELTAQGSPVRTLMIATNAIPYTLLVLGFAVGVWLSSHQTRVAHITGGLIAGYALVGLSGAVAFPMASRGTDGTLRNTLHIPATALMSLCVLAAMIVGARLFGARFRWYSYATVVTLLLFGFLTSLHGNRVANNESTPWMGIEERVNIYATMLWFAVLAAGLLRSQGVELGRRSRVKIMEFGRASNGRPKLPA